MCYTNSTNILREMHTYFKDVNIKSKTFIKKKKMLSAVSKPVDKVVFIATTSTSATLSNTGFRLIVKPISTDYAGGLSTSKNVLFERKERVVEEHERAPQNFSSFDKEIGKTIHN